MTARTIAYGRRPSQSLLDRLYQAVASFLDKMAVISARNGDIEPFGL